MFRLALVLMLVAGLLAGVSVAGSAYFTDTATVDGNVFSTGKIKITATPTTVALTLAKMAPGDQFVGPITIANDATDGDVDFTYLMSSDTTGNAALKSALEVEVQEWRLMPSLHQSQLRQSGGHAIASGNLGSSIAFTGGARTLLGNVSTPLATKRSVVLPSALAGQRRSKRAQESDRPQRPSLSSPSSVPHYP